MRGMHWITTSIPVMMLVAGTVAAPAASAASSRVCVQPDRSCQFTSIQAAINAATAGETIQITSGTYVENLVIGSSTATPLTLVAAGDVIVDGGHKGSVLSVAAAHDVKLVRLTLTHGGGTDIGGFSAGGGIANLGGTVEVVNSRIVDNTVALGFGGGVANTDGTLRLVSTVVTGNKASAGGGVTNISQTAPTVADLVNTTIQGNTSAGGPEFPAGGGGVQNCGILTMTNSSIRDNTASEGGGLTNCGNPGAEPGTATLTNTPITGNHATGNPSAPGGAPPGHGGGVSNGGTLKLVNSPVTSNTAIGPGGGIFNLPPGNPLGITGTVIRINSPVSGNTGSPPAAAQCFGTTC